MAGQYFGLPHQQYISSDVGSIVPMLNRVGEATDKRADKVAKAEDDATELLNKLKVAPTALAAKQKVVDEFNQKIQATADKALVDPVNGSREFNRLRQQIATDPRINALAQHGESYYKFAAPIEGDPNKYDPSVDLNRDIKDGTYNQQSIEDIIKTPSYRIAPIKHDFNKEMDDAATALKAKITNTYGEGAEPMFDDASGKWFVKTITGKTQEISANTVDEAAKGFTNTFLTGPESEYYKAHLSNTIGHDPNDVEFTKNYVKDRWATHFMKQEDTTEGLKQVSGSTDGSSSGSGSKKTTERYNAYKDLVDHIYQDKPTIQPDGSTKMTTGTANTSEAGMQAIMGSKEDGTTNLTGRRILLTTPDKAAENMQLTTAIDYNNKYSELRNDLEVKAGKENNRTSSNKVGDLDKTSIDALKRIEDSPRKLLHVSEDERIKESNKIAKTAKDYNAKLIEDFKSKNPKYANSDLRVAIDDKGNHFIAEDKYSKKIEVEKDPQLLAMKAEALANGIDLDNPDLKNKIKFASKNDELVNRFAQVLENGELDGEYTLVPHKGSDNVITDTNGNMYGKNDIFMTEEQLNLIMDSTDGLDLWGLRDLGWKKILNKNGPDGKPILKKASIKDKNNNPIQGYMMPATIQSTESVSDMTLHMQQNTFGKDAEKLQENLPKLIQESENATAMHKGERQLYNIEQAINKTSKNEEIVINTIDESIKNTKDPIIKEAADKYFKNINATKDKKERNKLYSDLYLYLNNPDAWHLIHDVSGNPPNPQNQGGAQEGWTTTPANPLAK